jgi:pSer/pThr/pTyr-binding forkhead associated (FHA) protein
MPYLSVWANGEEIDRLLLAGGSVTVGRAPECELAIRDILLSRQHCRLEPVKGRANHRWRLIDLGSRNGSYVHHKKIDNYVLVDGDTIRIGRTKLIFKTGEYVPLPDSPRKHKLVRPSDPHEALSGTVTDFVYAEHDPSEEFDVTPSPVAGDPDAVHASGSSLEELAHASWYGVHVTGTKTTTPTMAGTRRLARPMPRPLDQQGKPVIGSRTSQTDLSLQVHEKQVPFLQVMPNPPARRRNQGGPLVMAFILGAGAALATAAVALTGWLWMQQ